MTSLMPVASTMPLPCSTLRTRSLWVTCSLPEPPTPASFCSPHAHPCFWPVCGSYTSLLSSQNYLSSSSASFSCLQNRKKQSYRGWRGSWGSKGCLHPSHHPPSLEHLCGAPRLRAPNRALRPALSSRFLTLSVPSAWEAPLHVCHNKVTWDLPILLRVCLLCDAPYSEQLWTSGYLLKHLTPLSLVLFNICLCSTRWWPLANRKAGKR